MSLIASMLKRFVLGLCQGLGIAAGILLLMALFAPDDTLPQQVKSELSSLLVTGSAADVDLTEYQPAEKQTNSHLALIDNQFQIKPPADHQSYSISNTEQLYKALKQVKQGQGNAVFWFADGVYKLKKTLVIDKPNLFFLSQSGNPKNVVLNGRGMVRSHRVENLIEVKADGFVLDGLTLQQAGNHIIQIRAEQDADFPIIRNCIIQDGYEQLIKVSYDKRNKPDHYSDSGLVENCIFRYTAGIGPNYYIGGIDAHGIRNWIIRNNLFQDIASPKKHIAEHAIHIWNNTENNLVEANVIIDSDRGIGFGMWKKVKGNENQHIKFSNFAGVIRDNIIYHTDNGDPFADTGIVLENSPKSLVENNVIYMEHDYWRAIEYRFKQTQGVVIQNNHTNKNISSRNGGQAELINNNESLDRTDFLFKLNQSLGHFPFL